MDRKCIRWLYSELPTLVEKGIISSESAGKILEYYGEEKEANKKQVALTIFSIIGSILIGTGIILLLAHNWDQLSRNVRGFLSFCPLILSQVLVGYVMLRQKESTGWREGSGTLLMISIASSIALISQTYHIPGDFGKFLITVMLLSVPIVYLLNVTLPAVLYLIGITWWVGYVKFDWRTGDEIYLWPLLAIIVPFIWLSFKKDIFSPRSALLGWTFALAICIASAFTLEGVLRGFWIVFYSCLFSSMFLIGSRWFAQAPNSWYKPFYIIGGLGIAILSIMLTYNTFWEEINRSYYGYYNTAPLFAKIVEYAAAALLLILSMLLYIRRAKQQRVKDLLYGVFFIIAIAMYFLVFNVKMEVIAIIVFNIYVLALSLFTIVLGIREQSLSTLNSGMGILSLLIMVRFFDSDMSFIARGIIFILLGIGFLVTNMIMIRRKGGAR